MELATAGGSCSITASVDDVLSYTARGNEWIYPALGKSPVLRVCPGWLSLLSWLGAAACVGTVAVQLRRSGVVTTLLAVIASP